MATGNRGHPWDPSRGISPGAMLRCLGRYRRVCAGGGVPGEHNLHQHGGKLRLLLPGR